MVKFMKHSKKPAGLRIVIYGTEGIGKTSLIKKLRKPAFYDLEGTLYDDNPQYEVIETEKKGELTKEEFLGNINSFIGDHQGCETLVIDTGDRLEQFLIEDMCRKYDKTGVEDWGYGKGYTMISDMFASILERLSRLVESGMNVVIICHSYLRKQELPNERGAFDRYELKLSKKVAPLVKEWADLMMFCFYKTNVMKDSETKKVTASGGKRWTSCEHTVSWDGKCRSYIPMRNDISLDEVGKILQDVIDKSCSGRKMKTEPPRKEHEVMDIPDISDEEVAEKAEFPPEEEPEEEMREDIRKMLNLLDQYAVNENGLKEYIRSKNRLPEEQIDDIRNWPHKLVEWINRGMDKIAPKIKG